MASKSIVLKGTTYNGVESIELPQSGGGNVLFTEVSDTTATASDVASGKYFYTSAGVKTVGTASGGSSYTLLASTEVTVSTTSTSDISVDTISLGSSGYTSDKMVYVRIRDKAGHRKGYMYGTDSFLVNQYPKNGSTTKSNTKGVFIEAVTSNGYMTCTQGSYGVYANDINRYGDLTINARYSSPLTYTIDGTFTVEVYLLDWPGGVTPFVPPLT